MCSKLYRMNATDEREMKTKKQTTTLLADDKHII